MYQQTNACKSSSIAVSEHLAYQLSHILSDSHASTNSFTYAILFHQTKDVIDQNYGHTSIPNNITGVLFITQNELVEESINHWHPAKIVSCNLEHPKPKNSTCETNLCGLLWRNYLHAILTQMKSQMLEGLNHGSNYLHSSQKNHKIWVFPINLVPY